MATEPPSPAPSQPFEGFPDGAPPDIPSQSVETMLGLDDQKEEDLPIVDMKWTQVTSPHTVREKDGSYIMGKYNEAGEFISERGLEIKHARCLRRGPGLFYRFARAPAPLLVPSFERLHHALDNLAIMTSAPRVSSVAPSSSQPGMFFVPEVDIADPITFHRSLSKTWDKLLASKPGDDPNLSSFSGPKYRVAFSPESSMAAIQSFISAPSLAEGVLPSGLATIKDSLIKYDLSRRNKTSPILSILALLSQLENFVARIIATPSFKTDASALFSAINDIIMTAKAYSQAALSEALGGCAKSRLACRRAATSRIQERHAREMVHASPWTSDIMPRDSVAKAMASMPTSVVVHVKQQSSRPTSSPKKSFQPANANASRGAHQTQRPPHHQNKRSDGRRFLQANPTTPPFRGRSQPSHRGFQSHRGSSSQRGQQRGNKQ